MAFYENGSVRIHYEEGGSPDGYPLLLLAPGGLNSALGNWSKMAAFNPLEVFKDDFRIVAMDQRNANTGTSTGPVETTDPWDVFLTDELNLLDHFGIRGFLLSASVSAARTGWGWRARLRTDSRRPCSVSR